jgi:hypothetical protein
MVPTKKLAMAREYHCADARDQGESSSHLEERNTGEWENLEQSSEQEAVHVPSKQVNRQRTLGKTLLNAR